MRGGLRVDSLARGGVGDLRRKREHGRADGVLPGVWRLRLPLPWPGVPHVNAFAIDGADGIVLVDTGIYEDGSLRELERALDEAGRRLEDIELLVCTHAHSDHYGLAGPIVERAGCELWMHPAHAHMTRGVTDPERSLERRIEVARQSGVPLEPLRRWAEERRGQQPSIAEVVLPARELVEGTQIETGVGPWTVYETPGHAPSHISLYQPDGRLLLSGDHLLGRVSLYFDYGWTPDPLGEFVASLDKVERLGARLCLPGHGRAFGDVNARIQANREEMQTRLERTEQALASGPRTAYEMVPEVFERELEPMMMTWLLTILLCFLSHLERSGRVERITPGDSQHPERWRALAPSPGKP
jgi:glyoxylase-like metal-dependent hydrolase (beta-lactamase superfamily II)